jgi:hypothetical protein
MMKDRDLNNRSAAKLLLPFLLPTVLIILVVSTLAYNTVYTTLSHTLSDKSEMLTRNLATVLADPLARGEYDHMQMIIAGAQNADADMNYGLLLSPDGRVLASTDPSVKNTLLSQSGFDREALRVTDFVVHHPPINSNVFEQVMPVKSAGAQAGLLRVGYSLERSRAAAMNFAVTLLSFSTVAAVGGAWLYLYLLNKLVLSGDTISHATNTTSPRKLHQPNMESESQDGATTAAEPLRIETTVPATTINLVSQRLDTIDTRLDRLVALVDRVETRLGQIEPNTKKSL